ncbi:hypothetical protein Nmel_008536, partial [Mimus melanotis]
QSPEPTADSPLAPSAPGDETKEEQNDHKPPTVVTAQPEYLELALLDKEHEQIAVSEMPCQTQGELFPAREQEEQLRQQVEELKENGQNIKAEPQAELLKAQIAIKAVKRRHKEDVRSVQEEMSLHQQRGDQQNLVSNLKDQLHTELQETETRMKAREKRLEEEIKMIREKHNPLLQVVQKQVEVLTSHLPACRDFQQRIGNKKPHCPCEARELSQPEMLQVGHVPKMVKEKMTQWEEVEHLN